MRYCVISAVLTIAIMLPTEAPAISRHPHLLITPAGIERARERTRSEPWAMQIIDSLARQAQALRTEKLPEFDKHWWREASAKRWQDTYAEINHHTMFAVVGPVAKAADTALLYAITGDPEHAELVRRVLLHYCGYEFFAKHPDVGLNWSVWGMRALHAYDIVYDTLSDSDRAKIDDFFRRATEAVRKNDEWWIRHNPGGLFNNHFAWHKLFIGSCGLFYGNPDMVEYALESNQGIRELIENGSRDDGLWFESSLNYHFTAVDAIAALAHHLRNSGHPTDLWNSRFANGRSLRSLLTGPIGPLFPDETLPTIGDAYGRRLKLGQVKWYWMAYDVYRMPEIAWLLRNITNRPAEALFLELLPASPSAPRMTTRIWPEHGYIALRSQEGTDYWQGDGFSAFLSFDSDGIHSHRDKFGLTVFARGAHVAVDPEALSAARHAFSSRIQGELNRATVCHNTAMVDGRDHNPIGAKLELVDYIDAPDLKLATIADTRGAVYSGVRMSRTVAVTREYVLDVFQLTSEDDHAYEYLFHGADDNGAFASDDRFSRHELPCGPPWSWLRNANSGSMDGTWSVNARQGAVASRLTMLGEPGTEVVLCEFPRTETYANPSAPMLIARRKARATKFIALLQAERENLPQTSISVHEDAHGALRVHVEGPDSARDFIVRKLR